MKKYVCLALSVVFIVLSFAIIHPFDGIAVGKGNGQNAKVETLDEFVSIIDSAVASLKMTGPEEQMMGLSNSNKLPGGSKEHTSVTMETSQYVTNSYVMNGTGIYMKVQNSVQAEMTYYVSEDGQLYIEMTGEVSSNVSQSASNAPGNLNTFMSFEAKLYYGNDKLLIYYDDVIYAQNGMTNDMSMLLGKWIDFSDLNIGGAMGADVASNLRENDAKLLTIYGDYIDRYLDSGFEESNSVYTMNNDIFNSLCKEVNRLVSANASSGGFSGLDVQITDGDFYVDLSDKESPQITQSYKYKYPGSFNYGGQKYSIESIGDNSTHQEMIFKNIDNTKIEFPDDIKVYTLQELVGA